MVGPDRDSAETGARARALGNRCVRASARDKNHRQSDSKQRAQAVPKGTKFVGRSRPTKSKWSADQEAGQTRGRRQTERGRIWAPLSSSDKRRDTRQYWLIGRLCQAQVKVSSGGLLRNSSETDREGFCIIALKLIPNRKWAPHTYRESAIGFYFERTRAAVFIGATIKTCPNPSRGIRDAVARD